MVTPNDISTVPIINCLRDIDCCSRCILRFLKVKASTQTYLDPEVYLKTILDKNHDTEGELPVKKIKKNPCRVCLGILQDSTLETFAEGIKITDINEYSYADFITSIIIPKSVMIRNHSTFIYLKEKFPQFYVNMNGIDSVNKVFKFASSGIISRTVSKVFNQHSNFVLSFDIEYEDDDLEVENIKKLCHLIKKGQRHEVSKNCIVEILDKCEDTQFKQHFVVPPSVPSKPTKAKVDCMADSIWVGGRYLKFSRDMGQTPWIINNKVMSQYNLQDIIFDSFEKILGWNKRKLTFCASGREDADVRMLGNGRPFYIQLDNPRGPQVTFEQCRAIEKEISQSKLAAVVKLQNVPRSQLKRIKEGEQTKRKHYYALCHVDTPHVADVLNVINCYKNEALEIMQQTPLRVLHRRTQAVRKKHIYRMEAKMAEGYTDLIEVALVTEAGTYVKEFVNGDFRRTRPSLSSMIDATIDVVALDVTSIELEWPEE